MSKMKIYSIFLVSKYSSKIITNNSLIIYFFNSCVLFTLEVQVSMKCKVLFNTRCH